VPARRRNASPPQPIVTLAALLDLAKIAFVVAGGYLAFALYVRHRQPAWTPALQRRRLALLWAFLVVAGAIQVTEDVLGGESAPVDKAILLFVRDAIPHGLNPLFDAITLTGSSLALVPLTLFTVAVLWLRKHRFEALLVAASTIVGASIVYAVKTLVGRERPRLWETQWYWGSSFPSGHTLVVAAFATALALSLARLRPAARETVVGVALVWIALVALSRLVLGVHWPTDVLAAACIGAALPLAISLGYDFSRSR
jgi:undecaprenyl-diphosphatase